MKVELNLSIKADLKNATSVDTSTFAKKIDLASLKSEAGELDIDVLEKVSTGLNTLKSKLGKLDTDKLVPVPVDLSNLSDAVKNDVVKKYVYNAKTKDIKDKVPDITNLSTNISLNAKINGVKNKIPNITNLATTTALTNVENKMPDLSKYVTTPQFNKLTAENFTARLAQAYLASKSDIGNFVKKTDFDDKLKI